LKKKNKYKNMKTLKYIVVLGIFFLIACRPEIEKPDDVLPIDWENYNDVYTVFWNYRSKKCSAKTGVIGKIKVFGWISVLDLKENELLLVSNLERVPVSNFDNVYDSYIYENIAVLKVSINYPIVDELKAKLDTCDFTKKCFVEGNLVVEDRKEAPLCSIVPYIFLRNINDIYFEPDKIDSDE